MGVRPQEHINDTVLKDCDILVGVFWSRMGTDAGVGMTGTEEEIRQHILSGKKAHLYFSTKALPHEVDTEQLGRLRVFKAEIQKTKSGLYGEFSSPEEFRNLFRTHLDMIMNEAQGSVSPELPGVPRAGSTQEPSDGRATARQIASEISDNAAFVLKKAAASDHSSVLVKPHFIAIPGGPVWETSRNGQLNALLSEAIDELVDLELLRDHEGLGEKFRVTSAGFKRAATIPDSSVDGTEGD